MPSKKYRKPKPNDEPSLLEKEAHGQEFAPLAERLRPTTIEEVVGQRTLLGPGRPLRIMAERGKLHAERNNFSLDAACPSQTRCSRPIKKYKIGPKTCKKSSTSTQISFSVLWQPWVQEAIDERAAQVVNLPTDALRADGIRLNGLEVESTGAYYTRNIWLKRM